MQFLNIFVDVLQKLEQHKIPYMIVGSIASMIYGEPRMTHDMDIVIDLLPEHVKTLEKIFPLDQYYCPPEEIIRAEMIQRGQFNLLHHESGLKIDLMIRKNSAHSIEEFKRRRKTPLIGDIEAYIATAEDVIIKKLVFYREGQSDKHLKDIRGILAETEIDKNYLMHWIHELKLESEYNKI